MAKSKKTFKFNASDVLGALAMEAERIKGAAILFAHGAAFPDAELIAGTLDRMRELNSILLDQKAAAKAQQDSAGQTVN